MNKGCPEDGKKDLVITQNTSGLGSLCWIKNLGSGYFMAKTNFGTAPAYTGLTAGDMDNDTLHVTASEAFEAYRILDVTGKVVARQTLPAGTKNQQIDLGDLSSGLYFLEIRSGATASSRKFVKS